jgi:hypothetical protein
MTARVLQRFTCTFFLKRRKREIWAGLVEALDDLSLPDVPRLERRWNGWFWWAVVVAKLAGRRDRDRGGAQLKTEKILDRSLNEDGNAVSAPIWVIQKPK